MTGYQIQSHRILLCVLALFCLGMALMGCKKASLDDWYATQADALTQLYDAIFDSYASTFSSLRAQIADETGINDIAIRLTALNPDGTVLYSRDFTE